MSNLKRKMEMEKMRQLIFEMINEKSDSLYPPPSVLYTQTAIDSRQKAKDARNTTGPPDGSPPDVISKYIKNAVVNDIRQALFIAGVLEFAKRVSQATSGADLSFLEDLGSGFLSEKGYTTSWLGYPKNIKSYSMPGLPESAGQIYEELNSLNDAQIAAAPIGLVLLRCLSIANTFDMSLVKGGDGGPDGGHSIKIKANTGIITDDNAQYEKDLRAYIKRSFKKDVEKQFDEIRKELTRATDSLVNEANYRDFNELQGYIAREFRGESADNPSTILNILSSLTSFGFLNLEEDIKFHIDEDDTLLIKAAKAFFLTGTLALDAIDTIIGLGTIGGTLRSKIAQFGYIKGTASFASAFAKWYLVGVAFQAWNGGTRMLIEYSKYKSVLESVFKVIGLMVNDLESDILKEDVIEKVLSIKGRSKGNIADYEKILEGMCSDIYQNGKIVDDYKSAMSKMYVTKMKKQKPEATDYYSRPVGNDPLAMFGDPLEKLPNVIELEKQVRQKRAWASNPSIENLTDDEREDFLRTFYDNKSEIPSERYTALSEKPSEKLAAFKNMSQTSDFLKAKFKIIINKIFAPLAIQAYYADSYVNEIQDKIDNLKSDIETNDFKVIPENIYKKWEAKYRSQPGIIDPDLDAYIKTDDRFFEMKKNNNKYKVIDEVT